MSRSVSLVGSGVFFTLAVTENKSMNTVQAFQVPAFSTAGFTENRHVCGLQQLKSRYVSQQKRGTEQIDEDDELKKNRTVFSVFLSLSLSSSSSNNIQDQCLTITDIYDVYLCILVSVRTLTD